MIAAAPTDDNKPTLCPACGADSMGCAVKRGLSGRECCDTCSHLVGRVTPKREVS